MIYINIPYVPENDRIDRDLLKREIQILDICPSAKESIYKAIYNLRPRAVEFDNRELVNAIMLEDLLKRMGVPFRRTDQPEY